MVIIVKIRSIVMFCPIFHLYDYDGEDKQNILFKFICSFTHLPVSVGVFFFSFTLTFFSIFYMARGIGALCQGSSQNICLSLHSQCLLFY